MKPNVVVSLHFTGENARKLFISTLYNHFLWWKLWYNLVTFRSLRYHGSVTI